MQPSQPSAPIQSEELKAATVLEQDCVAEHGIEAGANGENLYQSLMKTDLSTFLKMSPEEQADTLNAFFSRALFDDEFVEFTKTMAEHWDASVLQAKPEI